MGTDGVMEFPKKAALTVLAWPLCGLEAIASHSMKEWTRGSERSLLAPTFYRVWHLTLRRWGKAWGRSVCASEGP